MAFPELYYSNSGSDTAAGGTDAPSTAVTGTNADGTAAGTTITLNGTLDFTGVADDGSDVIWCASTSGERHLFSISSFTGGVSTCTAIVTNEAIGATTFSGQNWAVGGRRATLHNDTTQFDTADIAAGWTISFESAYTNSSSHSYSIAGGNNTDGPVIIRTEPGWSTKADLQTTVQLANGKFQLNTGGSTNKTEVYNIKVSRTSGSSLGSRGFRVYGHVVLDGVETDSTGPGVYMNDNGAYLKALDCDFLTTNASGVAISHNSGRASLHFIACVFRGDGSTGDGYWHNSGSTLCSTTFIGCLFRDLGGSGLRINSAAGNWLWVVSNCVFHDCDAGIELAGTMSASFGMIAYNNIFTENSTYGIDGGTATTTACDAACHVDYNAYRNNTSGETNKFTKGTNSVTLTADPYTDESTDDYSLNATAGGGAACRDAGLGRTS